ncbi:hypothetical protein KW798_00215 [Candidatus Parcubacteria bacterium]|nr:hypothetical protein [Candidatus Parcubacteria bacterium]
MILIVEADQYRADLYKQNLRSNNKLTKRVSAEQARQILASPERTSIELVCIGGAHYDLVQADLALNKK